MKSIAVLEQKFGFGGLLAFFRGFIAAKILEDIETAAKSFSPNRFRIEFARQSEVLDFLLCSDSIERQHFLRSATNYT